MWWVKTIMKNEKGVTLVELLAAITILAVIGIIIWNVLIEGTSYSQQAMTKNQLTQEVNIVIARMQNEYQKLDEFKMTSGGCMVSVSTNESLIARYGDTHSKICFELYDGTNPLPIFTAEPKLDGALDNKFHLAVYEKDNTSNKIKIPFRLSRLKERGNSDG